MAVTMHRNLCENWDLGQLRNGTAYERKVLNQKYKDLNSFMMYLDIAYAFIILLLAQIHEEEIGLTTTY